MSKMKHLFKNEGKQLESIEHVIPGKATKSFATTCIFKHYILTKIVKCFQYK